jgi:hypothetical protein
LREGLPARIRYRRASSAIDTERRADVQEHLAVEQDARPGTDLDDPAGLGRILGRRRALRVISSARHHDVRVAPDENASRKCSIEAHARVVLAAVPLWEGRPNPSPWKTGLRSYSGR